MSKDNIWDGLHEKYKQTDWIEKPNIFAEEVFGYLPESGRLLDIGCGQGQDSRFFVSKGFQVTGIDISETALEEARNKQGSTDLEFKQVDVSQGLPFGNEEFEIVYAHLSLHYFDSVTTNKIFAEITRVLRPGGIFAFFTNSVTDPEYGQGETIEDDFLFVDGKGKRYFSVDSARKFASKYFDEILCDSKGETYKDSEKGIHNLIRYIGRKDG
jgi:SAM-dependent methyltransferase